MSDVIWLIFTGSSGGIGSEITKILARRGDAMILLNRSETKATAQHTELLNGHPNLNVELVSVDLMDTAQIKDAAQKISALPGRIEALYNNSGVLTSEKILSVQGLESHFAVNTLAPYILIQRLRSKMTRPQNENPAMIVNFSSSAISRLTTLELDNLATPEKVGGLLSTYAQSKLAVTALAPALADELASQNIFIRAIDPGATKSAMTTGGNSGMPKILAWLAPLLFSPADKQAAKIVDSAAPSAHDRRTGIYVANRKEKKMPAPAANREIQSKLISMLNQFAEA